MCLRAFAHFRWITSILSKQEKKRDGGGGEEGDEVASERGLRPEQLLFSPLSSLHVHEYDQENDN